MTIIIMLIFKTQRIIPTIILLIAKATKIFNFQLTPIKDYPPEKEMKIFKLQTMNLDDMNFDLNFSQQAISI